MARLVQRFALPSREQKNLAELLKQGVLKIRVEEHGQSIRYRTPPGRLCYKMMEHLDYTGNEESTASATEQPGGQ